MTYFLVIGRVSGDDEDSGFIFHTHSKEHARRAFRKRLHRELLDDSRWTWDEIKRGERNGDCVYINAVYASDTRIYWAET